MQTARSILRVSFGAKVGVALASCLLLSVVPSELCAQPAGKDAPKTPPQDPNSTQSDTRRGETLSERLDRNNGVITPPSGTDPGIAVPAPVPNPNSTPVIPPPGSPGGNQSVRPK
jgi:hypothetical protein